MKKNILLPAILGVATLLGVMSFNAFASAPKGNSSPVDVKFIGVPKGNSARPVVVNFIGVPKGNSARPVDVKFIGVPKR